MLHLLSIFFQFVTAASDPSWSCELTHHDPDVAGTYYLYCTQTSPDGVELIQVGRFVSDAKVAKTPK
jgi:hypothetical protein